MGGALAIGAYTDPRGLDSSRAQRDLKTAKALTYTCKSIQFIYFNMETSLWSFFYGTKVTKCMPGAKQEYHQNTYPFTAVMILVFHLMRLVFASVFAFTHFTVLTLQPNKRLIAVLYLATWSSWSYLLFEFSYRRSYLSWVELGDLAIDWEVL